ncbi:sacsin N-terminal ATP-binding-like domain-containing protein, partial [Nodularia sp. UHCC 0506]|uniref:sacsin N-terminal ATP-binding-like domain-containing protein n=1 Tax=Nodularia sp. UHCC 0506 TaxID=3110243 RepID=UPI002B216028
MAGYQIPPGTIVNNIKSLLRERYKQGFPIIKEIIQNANDGRATTLEFGIVKELGDAVEHPLLKIPGLFFLNNGTFTKSDKESISCFGIDANAKDKGKIGKFGLGQKSIFHFCEAFFYIARSQDIQEGCGEFINPWANYDGLDSKRPEWGELSLKDRQFLENYLIQQNLVKPQSSYFLLWIPLRQQMADERCILANYYNDAKSVESNLPEDMKMRIGQLLPLLRHIRNVRYWLENNRGSLKPQFSVSLDSHNPCERCIYPNSESEIIQQDEHDLQGRIIISTDATGIRFAGKERILPANEFSLLLGQDPERVSNTFWDDLQQSSYWTKRVSINESAESESIPDKSIPHCAVVFTKQSLNNRHKARLMLQWSVFLPLASDETITEGAEQEAYEVIDCQGEQDYTIFLHGYFFLDSGRKYIEGLPKIRTGGFVQKTPTNEDEMIAQWNYLLATKGTLKLFLPSLENFVKVHSLSTPDISQLCEAIFRSQLFKSKVYKQSICSEAQWVFRIKPSRSAWELIPVNANVRPLPGVPPNWEIFPGLGNLAERYHLIDKEQPNLLSNETSVDWQEQEIINLLNSL